MVGCRTTKAKKLTKNTNGFGRASCIVPFAIFVRVVVDLVTIGECYTR